MSKPPLPVIGNLSYLLLIIDLPVAVTFAAWSILGYMDLSPAQVNIARISVFEERFTLDFNSGLGVDVRHKDSSPLSGEELFCIQPSEICSCNTLYFTFTPTGQLILPM